MLYDYNTCSISIIIIIVYVHIFAPLMAISSRSILKRSFLVLWIFPSYSRILCTFQLHSNIFIIGKLLTPLLKGFKGRQYSELFDMSTMSLLLWRVVGLKIASRCSSSLGPITQFKDKSAPFESSYLCWHLNFTLVFPRSSVKLAIIKC